MHAARPHATPRGGLQLPAQDARQHGLADTVAPDQAGGTIVELLGQFREERPAVGQDVGNAFQRQLGI
ncbi:hypothetical protein D3C87_1864410 [compost metagenome]